MTMAVAEPPVVPTRVAPHRKAASAAHHLAGQSWSVRCRQWSQSDQGPFMYRMENCWTLVGSLPPSDHWPRAVVSPWSTMKRVNAARSLKVAARSAEAGAPSNSNGNEVNPARTTKLTMYP